MLECISSLSRPQPVIVWFMGQSYSNASVVPSISYNETDGTYNFTRSLITIMLNTANNNKWIFCNSSNVPDVESVSSEYSILDIQYPPSVGQLEKSNIIEGKHFLKACPIREGNPAETNISWTSTEKTSIISANVNLDIVNISRNQTAQYTCIARNMMTRSNGSLQEGISRNSFYLNVLYPPEQFSVTCLADNVQNDNIADVLNITEGRIVTLKCSAISNPPPSNYSWSGRMAFGENYLTFYVMKNHSGDYICTASNTMEETPTNRTIVEKSKKYRMNVLYPPQISEMDNITVIEGKSVEFKGNVIPGKPQEMQYYWKRQSDQQVWTTETFSISSVSRSHESEYIFSVRNLMKPTCGKEVIGYSNKTLFMKVLYPPESLQVTCLTDSSKNDVIVDVFYITEGTNLTLICSANSNPSPSSYFWSGRMANNQSIITFYVIKQHSGDYICTANNSMQERPGNTTIGTKSKTYHMSVLYAPVVNKMPNMTAVEGERLTVYCQVTLGNPSETTFKWIRKSDNRTWNGQTMIIHNITRHDDNTYTCISNNTLQPTYGNTIIGVTSQSVNVEVFYKSTIKRFVIEGHSSQNNVTVNETDLVAFTCTVESNPASFMKLTFEDKLLLEKNSTKDLVHVIYKAKCTDWGTYFCFGYNSHNSLQNIPRIYINMYVNCAPRQSSTVYPSNNVTNVTSEQHVSSTLTFKALAYPKPSVRWYKKHDYSWIELSSDVSKNIWISFSENRLEYNLTLLNITQSEYGQYRLDITNRFGQHVQIFNLIPNDKPSPPKQFGVYDENIRESSVTLWWEPGFDGGLRQTFIIGIKEETIWKNYTFVEDTDATIINFTVTGLRSGTQYYFRIYASNQLGSTRFPDEIIVKTKALPFKTDSNVAVVGPAIGGAFGVLLVVVALVSITLFCRKRRSGKRPDTPIYQNMKSKVTNGEAMSSLDSGRSNIYEKLQNTGSDQQYQQLSAFACEGNEGQHKIYENLRLTQANGQQGSNVENTSGCLKRELPNKNTQSIV